MAWASGEQGSPFVVAGHRTQREIFPPALLRWGAFYFWGGVGRARCPHRAERVSCCAWRREDTRMCLALQNSPGALVVSQTPTRNPEGCQTVRGSKRNADPRMATLRVGPGDPQRDR